MKNKKQRTFEDAFYLQTDLCGLFVGAFFLSLLLVAGSSPWWVILTIVSIISIIITSLAPLDYIPETHPLYDIENEEKNRK